MSAGVQYSLDRAFDNFLYSPVGVDPDQMPVSVLSALARHDIDPWVEAAQLAQMPKSIAIARLTNMISPANPDFKAQSLAKQTATRLIELLPYSPLLGIPRPRGIALPKLPDNWTMIAWIALSAVLITLAVFGG